MTVSLLNESPQVENYLSILKEKAIKCTERINKFNHQLYPFKENPSPSTMDPMQSFNAMQGENLLFLTTLQFYVYCFSKTSHDSLESEITQICKNLREIPSELCYFPIDFATLTFEIFLTVSQSIRDCTAKLEFLNFICEFIKKIPQKNNSNNMHS